jgi:RNA polymerase subunit RPABC4/transcription elongation factor Spt4
MDLQELIVQLERILRIIIAVVVAFWVALTIACVWWTFRDIRSRTTDIFLQLAATLLVAVFSFAGLLIYVIVRPTKTLAQLYQESLEEEAFLQGIQVHNSCPVCKQRVEQDFIFCPWCQTRLKRTCARCERPLLLRWKMCPFCGQAVYLAPGADEATALPTMVDDPALVRPRG